VFQYPPTFADVPAGTLPDFQFENDRQRGVTFVTPYTQKGKDYAAECLPKIPQHGRSFFFALEDGKPSVAVAKLKGFLKREGYVISR
jgi:hypothetical protein